MKFVSIDLETTGIDPQCDQILEMGAVIVDTETHPSTWPTFHKIIKHDSYKGNAFAIQMNNRLFRILAGVDKTDIEIISIDNLVLHFSAFCHEHKLPTVKRDDYIKFTFTVAGKNVAGFDMQFLNKIALWGYNFEVSPRTIDPGPMYIDFTKDIKPPDLKLCKERAGINTPVTHNALEDAWDVVYVICAKMGWNFNKVITNDYLSSTYKEMGDETDMFWSYDKFHIIAYHTAGDIFNKYFIQNIVTGERRYVWNQNEL